MKKELVFKPIDLSTWPMAQAFHYYTQIAPTSYTINVSLDVTILRSALRQKGYKFFPACAFLATRAIEKVNQGIHEITYPLAGGSPFDDNSPWLFQCFALSFR